VKTPKRVTPKELVSSNAWLTDACSSSINEHSRRKGVKSVEVGGENDARGHVPPAKDTQKTSQYVPEIS
jgi:hypothetical protein